MRTIKITNEDINTALRLRAAWRAGLGEYNPDLDCPISQAFKREGTRVLVRPVYVHNETEEVLYKMGQEGRDFIYQFDGSKAEQFRPFTLTLYDQWENP